jgi:hypothetical protein
MPGASASIPAASAPVDDLLEVVEDEQHLPLSEVRESDWPAA